MALCRITHIMRHRWYLGLLGVKCVDAKISLSHPFLHVLNMYSFEEFHDLALNTPPKQPKYG